MAQNRNDQHDEHEESEYRFSDDEISYEVEEGESAKAAHIGESKKEFKLSRFKRLIISVVGFIILFVIVYKMLAPPSTTIPEIASVPAAGPSKPLPATAANTEQPVQLPASSSTPAYPAADRGQQQAAAALPGQMTLPISQPGETDARLAAISVENEKRINQLSTDYNQKLSEFAAQNKQLQDQVQLLTAKIGSLETQMNQLVQVLIHQSQNNTSPAGNARVNANSSTTSTGTTASDTTPPYNVQAIIPGRAWLKAENGETVTVAEGDTIKGLGRVTKIDPYDGIVEVNTGSKALSLSYGSNG